MFQTALILSLICIALTLTGIRATLRWLGLDVYDTLMWLGLAEMPAPRVTRRR